MARQHGITSTTYQKFLIDSGAIYKNYGIPVRTITLASVIATDAITVSVTTGGATTTKTFTCVASGATGDQFNVEVSDSATATNLNALITAMAGITSTANSAVITVTGDSISDLVTITTADTTFTLGTNGLNTTSLGATRGGNTITIETEYRVMEVDGARGKVKGGRRITNVDAKVTANIVEFSAELLTLALPGSSAADYPVSSTTHKKITRSLGIVSGDYPTNIALVGQDISKNQPCIFIVNNPLQDGNFEIGFNDKDESVIALTFSAHFSPDALDTEPYEVYYPTT